MSNISKDNPHGEYGIDWHWLIYIQHGNHHARIVPSWSEEGLLVNAIEVEQAQRALALAASLFQISEFSVSDSLDLPDISTYNASKLRAALVPLADQWVSYQKYLKDFVPGKTREAYPCNFMQWLWKWRTPDAAAEQTIADQFEQAFKLINPPDQKDNQTDDDQSAAAV